MFRVLETVRNWIYPPQSTASLPADQRQALQMQSPYKPSDNQTHLIRQKNECASCALCRLSIT